MQYSYCYYILQEDWLRVKWLKLRRTYYVRWPSWSKVGLLKKNLYNIQNGEYNMVSHLCTFSVAFMCKMVLHFFARCCRFNVKDDVAFMYTMVSHLCTRWRRIRVLDGAVFMYKMVPHLCTLWCRIYVQYAVALMNNMASHSCTIWCPIYVQDSVAFVCKMASHLCTRWVTFIYKVDGN